MSSRYSADIAGQMVIGRDAILDEAESHHLLRVMRACVGDRIRLFSGGREFEGTLERIESGRAVVRLSAELPVLPLPRLRLSVAVPAIKGGGTELVTRRLTELGVAQIIAFATCREVSRLGSDKVAKLARVAVEACKQCGRADVPAITWSPSLLAAIESSRLPAGHCLVLYERESALRLSTALRQVIADETAGPRPEATAHSVCLLVASGPEGGFAPEEIAAVEACATCVTLGPRILRADTAPIAAAAIALAATGDM